MNIATLPTVSDATLPETYQAAQTALANCQQIDECQQWSDKAAALASYAKQSQDESLMKMAQRIRARASRRAGELLQQIEPQQGGDRVSDHWEVNHPMVSRTSAARDAGMSEHQQKQATRIASVPESEFEAQVESPNPPTLSQLAQQGIKPKPVMDLKGRNPRDFNRALHFVAVFSDYARELEKLNVSAGIEAMDDKERAKLRGFINSIDAVHDHIMTRI